MRPIKTLPMAVTAVAITPSLAIMIAVITAAAACSLHYNALISVVR